MIHLKNIFEEKLKISEIDNDEKQKTIYDHKNSYTVIEMQKI